MKRSTSWMSVLPSLVIPLAIGAMMYMGLYAAIQTGWVANDQILRYLTGHPISKLTTAMFFVGGASLLLIGLNIFEQFRWESRIKLPFPKNAEQKKATEIETSDDSSMSFLSSLPDRVQDHYLVKRLASAIEYVDRTGSASNVEEELKYLAENDHHAQQQQLSLVRIMIWAMPMLGFLGTVLGISQALGGLSIGADQELSQVMGGLQASLYVAFDTTALALTLSIVLMFCAFVVERFEIQLLDHVELRARKEVSDQFDFTAKPDSAVQTVERIGRGVLAATHEVVQKQVDLWRGSIDQAEEAWTMSNQQTHESLRQNLSVVMDEAMTNMAHLLSQAIGKADESLATRWEQWQITMSDTARQLSQQQESLQEHTQLIQSLFQQLENLGQYQTALNRNLDALTSTGRLEATLSSLNSVIFDLNRKMGKKIIESATTDTDASTPPAVPFDIRIAEGTSRAA
ncbi:MotA/TolQ/ExbB proton channel family protein [bacterium]|nr:MotA/TolQ/ExbB proton channel family protein [bacterium]